MFCNKCGNELPDNSNFCHKCGYTVAKIITNNYKFQSDNENVDTCGRQILARILMFECGRMKAREFEKFIKSNAKKLNLTTDELVVKMIQL